MHCKHSSAYTKTAAKQCGTVYRCRVTFGTGYVSTPHPGLSIRHQTERWSDGVQHLTRQQILHVLKHMCCLSMRSNWTYVGLLTSSCTMACIRESNGFQRGAALESTAAQRAQGVRERYRDQRCAVCKGIVAYSRARVRQCDVLQHGACLERTHAKCAEVCRQPCRPEPRALLKGTASNDCNRVWQLHRQ